MRLIKDFEQTLHRLTYVWASNNGSRATDLSASAM
jgi:hypothetical protein